jgi:hypothetical protein
VRRLAPVLSGLDQGPQAHAGLQLRCTSSGAPLALEPRPRRATASPLRLRIARGGDAGAGTLGGSNFRRLGPGGWPPRPPPSPATPPEAPRDLFTHTRARHGARMARARATWAPGRFGPGLDCSGVWHFSATRGCVRVRTAQMRGCTSPSGGAGGRGRRACVSAGGAGACTHPPTRPPAPPTHPGHPHAHLALCVHVVDARLGVVGLGVHVIHRLGLLRHLAAHGLARRAGVMGEEGWGRG